MSVIQIQYIYSKQYNTLRNKAEAISNFKTTLVKVRTLLTKLFIILYMLDAL